ncbi:hypothetical protein AOQ84DRAFT_372668 [Glonium stellatum]|uniref:Uncharacterized protein n=1 Tax=Glonium stellatum TaxID=574774 RepID=A0A8E2F967_9PEZI|nr:hypothetical protein AOQ84DRAFT_372668 [Glonium stellatum]
MASFATAAKNSTKKHKHHNHRHEHIPDLRKKTCDCHLPSASIYPSFLNVKQKCHFNNTWLYGCYLGSQRGCPKPVSIVSA